MLKKIDLLFLSFFLFLLMVLAVDVFILTNHYGLVIRILKYSIVVLGVAVVLYQISKK